MRKPNQGCAKAVTRETQRKATQSQSPNRTNKNHDTNQPHEVTNQKTIVQKRRPGRPPKAKPVEVPTFFAPTQRTEYFFPKPPNETFQNSTQFNIHHTDVPPKYNLRTTIKRTQRY